MFPLLYPDVGPEERLRLEPVHKVLLLVLVRCLRSSYTHTHTHSSDYTAGLLLLFTYFYFIYSLVNLFIVLECCNSDRPWSPGTGPAAGASFSPAPSSLSDVPEPWRSPSSPPPELGRSPAAAARCQTDTGPLLEGGLGSCHFRVTNLLF